MKLLSALSIFIIVLLCAACRTASSGSSTTNVTTIQNIGSDTIVNLALAWAEKYQTIHPEVSISVTGGGSGTGLASLVNQTADIANASRQIKQEESDTLIAQGTPPFEYVIARDAIAVIVHPDNPVDQLTLQQVSDIYSGKITNWKEVGGEDRPIVRLSRETNSGTHVYFLETVLRLGDKDNKTFFSANTLLLPSSAGITTEVRQNPNAIGYDGLGYITPEEKVLAIAEKEGGPYVLPSVDTVNQGSYPISRDLYMYTAGEAQGIVKDYLDWIVTPEAQAIVTELGFVPIKTP